MTLFLIHWAGFLFLVGLILSLPLGTVYYLKTPSVRQFFTNPRKLKSAHLDFILQAFSLAMIYVLEAAINVSLPVYAVIPLAFGTFFNPFIFLLEATPFHQRGRSATLYKILRATSPSALFFAWSVLAFQFLPAYLLWLLAVFAIILVAAFITNTIETKKIADKQVIPSEKSM